MRTIALIDADVVVYQQSLAVESAIHWGDDLWTLHCDFREVQQRVDIFLDDMQEVLNADGVILALSCHSNSVFRRQVDSTYKENRIGRRKPVVYGAIRDYLMKNYNAVLRNNLEADDILGILSTEPYTKDTFDEDLDEERIILSIDKDFFGVPGFVFNWNKEEEGVVEVTEHAAAWFHAFQTLTGDSADGYKGCPGVGPVTAKKLLSGKNPSEFWEIIAEEYDNAGLTEAYALQQARLAYILRHKNYNKETGQIKLWQPSAWN